MTPEYGRSDLRGSPPKTIKVTMEQGQRNEIKTTADAVAVKMPRRVTRGESARMEPKRIRLFRG